MAKKNSTAAAEVKKQLWAAWTRDVIAHFPYSGSNDVEDAVEMATDIADGLLEAYEELERMLKTGKPRRVQEEEAPDEEEESEDDDDDEDDE